jgi:ATP-dependent protease ClpP protease subunit
MANYEERQKLINEWESKRGSTLLTYFTLTDRLNAPPLLVADDAIRPFHTLLSQIGHRETIELFIYTRGGAVMSAYAIVKMFREYAYKFNVIVPFRAHSAGTQIALGADEIIMGKIGQLSPVDPSTANIFNPLLNPQGNPADLRNRKAISVEDVQKYLDLAKNRVGLVSESDRLEVFKELTRYYEPPCTR